MLFEIYLALIVDNFALTHPNLACFVDQDTKRENYGKTKRFDRKYYRSRLNCVDGTKQQKWC